MFFCFAGGPFHQIKQKKKPKPLAATWWKAKTETGRRKKSHNISDEQYIGERTKRMEKWIN